MKEITREWLKYAESDLETAKILLEYKSLANIASFHSQQVIEKCFKAVLEEMGQKVLKTHSLLALYDKILPFIDFTVNTDKLDTLEKIYIDSRYPGELGLLPTGMPSYEEAVNFYEFAKEIYEKTLKFLEK